MIRRLPTRVLAAAALVGFTGAAAVPAGWLVWWFTAEVVLPPLLGVLALAGFAATPTLLPARSRQRASIAVAAERPASPGMLADGRAPRRLGGHGAAPTPAGPRLPPRGAGRKLPASHSRRHTGPSALGAGGPTTLPAGSPVDWLTPHITEPGRANVQGGA